MYRDDPTALDERDRAVGAILIGEALLASCERARVIGQSDGPDAWRAIRDAHDEFPEIWRSLDRARHVLARRGVNVTGYDELRPHVRTHLAALAGDAEAFQVDAAALDDARRATHELKLAVPGADWAAIERRTSGLVQAPLTGRPRNRLIVSGLVATVVVVALLGIPSLAPVRKPIPHDDAMRRQIAEIAQQRKHKIVELQASLGERCDPRQAHELARQLVLDGRGADVRQFAAAYTERCGEDPVVVHWASAPLHKQNPAPGPDLRAASP
jgi:hypothetical protein